MITTVGVTTQQGQETRQQQIERTLASIPPWMRVAGMVAGAAGAYHGYKRNSSIGWAVAWSIFGSTLPLLAAPVMLAQGFGKKK